MGLAQGSQPLAFGHSEQAAVDVEGLVVRHRHDSSFHSNTDGHSYFQLLEDHLKQLRAEEGIESGDDEEDDEAAWEGWDVESDSSDSSSESGDWINVPSDGEDHLSLSDSEDEDGKKKKKNSKGKANADDDEDEEPIAAAPEPDRISSLATTKVNTSASLSTYQYSLPHVL